MNEFTNPAGNLGNNPFLQAPSTISPMKGTLPEVYKRLFREMGKVYNDNNYKSKEDGKEEKR